MKYVIYLAMVVSTMGMMLLVGEQLMSFRDDANQRHEQKIANFDPETRRQLDVRERQRQMETQPKTLEERMREFHEANNRVYVPVDRVHHIPLPQPLPVEPRPAPVRKITAHELAVVGDVMLYNNPVMKVVHIFDQMSYLHQLEEAEKAERLEAYRKRLDNRKTVATARKGAIVSRMQSRAQAGPRVVIAPSQPRFRSPLGRMVKAANAK